MNLPGTMGALLMVAALVTQASPGQQATDVQIEVNFLLGYIAGSECEFYRNGTWHDPRAARVHLNDKYLYLRARGLIGSAEDFIEKAATKSSLTGEPYQVRCKGGAPVATRQWLIDELARFRAFNKRPASSALVRPEPHGQAFCSESSAAARLCDLQPEPQFVRPLATRATSPIVREAAGRTFLTTA
jgi:hypothetical protein